MRTLINPASCSIDLETGDCFRPGNGNEVLV